jgi:hypothetical protein
MRGCVDGVCGWWMVDAWMVCVRGCVDAWMRGWCVYVGAWMRGWCVWMVDGGCVDGVCMWVRGCVDAWIEPAWVRGWGWASIACPEDERVILSGMGSNTNVSETTCTFFFVSVASTTGGMFV